MTERLITIDWQQPLWRETTLLTHRSVQFATAKTYVFSDSVLCLGGISDEPVKAWERKIYMVFGNTLSHRFGSDRRGADGVRVDKFPKIHFIADPRRDPEDNDFWIKVWTWALQRKDHLHVNAQRHCMEKKRGTKENCIANAHRVTEYARRFTRGHWSFLWSGSKKKWFGTHVNKLDGELNKTAEGMMLNIAERGHPEFRATSAFERGEQLPDKRRRAEEELSILLEP